MKINEAKSLLRKSFPIKKKVVFGHITICNKNGLPFYLENDKEVEALITILNDFVHKKHYKP